ncbi:MAG TPA: T9SS type A sorting domain-containing protein [Bacteroidetes bacterium]|nr:T9SS type A sorting domain-containing protein [Bacteroidota bacterium]
MNTFIYSVLSNKQTSLLFLFYFALVFPKIYGNTSPLLTLSCPDDVEITVNNWDCTGGSYLEFDSLEWSSTVPLVDTLFTPGPDHFFTPGTTLVELTATGTNGIVFSCAFNVTLHGPTDMLNCNDNIAIQLNEDCQEAITPEIILEGGPFGCPDRYRPTIFGPVGQPMGDTVTLDFVGSTWTVRVTDDSTGNYCWGTIIVLADSLIQNMFCPSDTVIFCHEPSDTIHLGIPFIETCLNTNQYGFSYFDSRENSFCGNGDTSFTINRKWKVTSIFGEVSNCTQHITAVRPSIDDFVFPPDFDGTDQPKLTCSDNSLPEILADTSITGTPLINGLSPFVNPCRYSFIFTDSTTNICGNQYEIMREWTIFENCNDDIFTHIQTIIIADEEGPIFNIPDTIHVSTALPCGTESNLPPIDLIHECSDFEVMVETPWNTLNTNGGLTGIPQIPGNYNALYTATDACGNISIDTSVLSVDDIIISRCPEAVTISCDEYFADLQEGLDTGNYSVLAPYGYPLFAANCDLEIIENTAVDVDSCGNGTIVRNFEIMEGNDTCQQIITVQYTPDLMIVFPPDIVIECGTMTPDYGEPEISNQSCELLQIDFTDELFEDVPNACYKILRTWTVTNPCANGNDDTTHMQVVTVIDQVDPLFTNGCAIPDVCTSIDACNIDSLIIPQPLVDDCTEGVTILTQFKRVDTWLSGAGPYFNVPAGVYEVRYIAQDNCFNQTACEAIIRVKDCQAPTAICDTTINVELLFDFSTGAELLDIYASDLIENSFDNCSEQSEIRFSFSPDPNDIVRTFTCDDLGINNIEIWATDISENQVSCEATIIINPNSFASDPCNDPASYIYGNISTEINEGINNVDVQNYLGDNIQTDIDGNYILSSVSDTATLTPFLDADYLNGVTTYDLVLLTKHTLNIQPLDSPYKIIAADVNNSGTVTTFDGVIIRKLILGIIPSFPETDSWRFVPKDYIFPDPNNPSDPAFPESIIVGINDDPPYDFIGIKTGDLNNSASPSFTNTIDDRNYIGNINFYLPNIHAKKGGLVSLPITLPEVPVHGFQMALKFDIDNLEFVNALPGFIENNSFGKNKTEEGILKLSWASPAPYIPEKGRAVFTLQLKARSNGYIKNWLKIDPATLNAEAYSEDLNLLNPILNFNKNQSGETHTQLFPNHPNPFNSKTTIPFFLSKKSEVKFTFFSPSGKMVFSEEAYFNDGYQQLEINANSLDAVGILFLKMETTDGIYHGKIIVQK